MKTILVPTDFSINAERALNFAAELAKKQKSKLILLHVYQVPIAVAAVSFKMLALEKEELQTNILKKIKALSVKLDMQKDLTYEYVVEEGETVESILYTASKRNVDLIIMGTKGETGLVGSVFGSNTEKVIARSECPVMAIPENTLWTGVVKKITYASNYNSSDLAAIAKLGEIAAPINAQLNILHISNDEFTAEKEVEMMDEFKKKVELSTDYNNLSFQIIHGNKIEEQLEKYINNGGTDLFVLAARDHNFLERLFLKNIASDLLDKGSIPLIIFHVKN